MNNQNRVIKVTKYSYQIKYVVYNKVILRLQYNNAKKLIITYLCYVDLMDVEIYHMHVCILPTYARMLRTYACRLCTYARMHGYIYTCIQTDRQTNSQTDIHAYRGRIHLFFSRESKYRGGSTSFFSRGSKCFLLYL